MPNDATPRGGLDVAIVLPVFNGAKYVAEAIDSVFAQSSPHWRLMVVDDGSTDASRDVVAAYRDPRVFVDHHSENVGLYGTLHRVINRLEVDWVAVLMQDDRLHPEYLRTMADVIASHPVDGVWTAARTIDARGRLLASPEAAPAPLRAFPAGVETWRQAVREGCFWTISGSMTRRRVFDDVPFRADLPHCGDYDFLLRAGRNRVFARVETPLIDLRRHPEQASARHMRQGRHLAETHLVIAEALQRHPADMPAATVAAMSLYRAGQCVRTMARNAILGEQRSVPRLIGTGLRFLALPMRAAAWRRRDAVPGLAPPTASRDAARR